MGFTKRASVQVIASAVVDGTTGGLQKLASQQTTARSYYLDGSRKIDVAKLLGKVADKFAVSANPSDYIFEAIRANTTNVPNENHDGFHQSELLRFDLRMGMPVYHSYVGKPHHVNHRTSNPKTARGVIVDVHYNDDAPALEACPAEGCNTRTAERSNRDATGIHCAKCGTVVKDEFVEALVAVDTKKDPVFAEGVRTGQLNASSMGCTCAYTTCNVCQHVATSRPEFCDHIRTGNKGTFWRKADSGGKWTRIEAKAAKAEFAKRGMAFVASDFCSLRTDDGFEVRKAFEYCGDVEFDELSRVDQPADPKALQREILKSASSELPSAAELQAESEALIKATAAVAAQPQRKAAQLSPETIQELQSLDPETALQQVEEALAGAHEGDVIVNINDPETSPSDAPAVETQSIEDYSEQELDDVGPTSPGDENVTPEEMGFMPPGASKEADGDVVAAPAPTRSARMYAKTYQDWTVEVTAQGTARVVSPAGPVLLVKAAAAPKNDTDRVAFGREVLSHIFSHGLVKTAERYSAVLDSKFAQVVDYAVDDMKGFEDKYMADSVLENGESAHDMAGVDKSDNTPEVIGDGEDNSDMADKRDGAPESTLEEGALDHELQNDVSVTPGDVGQMTEEDNSDMRADRQSPPDSALDNETHDHKERLAAKKHAARLEKLTAAKLAQAKADGASEVAAAKRAAIDTFTRALRIVAKRHSRNLELSPLKEALGVVLASSRTVGQDAMTGEPLEYEPLPQDLTVHLVEAAWKDGADAQIEELIRRATELSVAGDEYLRAAESDIEKIAHTVPSVNSAVLSEEDFSVAQRATTLRQAAKQGSMALPAAGAENTNVGADRRSAIQAAIGGSLLNNKRNQFRPN